MTADLIERAEREGGSRWDANGGHNMAMNIILGALARELGQSSLPEKDDAIAGMMIRHQMTPEYRQKKAADHIICDMIIGGMSPDDIKAIIG